MSNETIRITLRIPREVHAEIVRLSRIADRSLNWQMVHSMKIGAEQIAENMPSSSSTHWAGPTS